jgi:hypothetical protein
MPRNVFQLEIKTALAECPEKMVATLQGERLLSKNEIKTIGVAYECISPI